MRFEISEIITQDQVMDLVYGNNSMPKRILGRHYVKDGQVISAYHPDAVEIELIKDNGDSYKMDPIERQPVYALYLPEREPFHYQLKMTFRDGNTFVSDDPYGIPCQITETEEESFLAGEWIGAHRKMGCHHMTIQGVEGMYFAFWAPISKRVSVVGDFNFWNGMIYPMNRLERSGIYELFIPGLSSDHLYKFEIKTMQGEVYQIADPCGLMQEEGDGNASKMLDINDFSWSDQSWMRNRKYKARKTLLSSVCDVFDGTDLDMGLLFDGTFSHLLFSQHIIKGEGRRVNQYATGMCRTPYCGGSVDRLRKVIDEAHNHGVGVLLEISPGFFSVGESGGAFDSPALYGYSDSRIGYDPERNMWRFCFKKPEVRSLALSALALWIRQYHVDGFVFEGISDMIVPGVDTSNNLDMTVGLELEQIPRDNIHFLRQAVSLIRQEDVSLLLIADERMDTGSRGRSSLYRGFDYYWDRNLRSNMKNYLTSQADRRWKEHYRLTLPLQNQELESSLLLINPERKSGKFSIDNLPPVEYDKLSAESRMTEAFLMGVPGKKAWSLVGTEDRDKAYIRKLFEIYRGNPALSDSDSEDISFEWVNCVDAVSSVVSFVRRTSKKNNLLLFVSNFSGRLYEDWQLGVPEYGRYRLLLSSDGALYGGTGIYDRQDEVSRRQRCDFRPWSIRISLPPLTTLIFTYIQEEDSPVLL
ncbi:MAG: alpha amylase C-terminal domain-containing protein [Eubacterium sp.]|nr:alpha amylase C-terminal domain-containing protein [Eubacterium sp.]